MFRRLALTLIPGAAILTVAALALASFAPRTTAAHSVTRATTTVQVAARSGYIVASS